MTIASEITRIKTNIENAYIKAEEKGATIPEVRNSENLASCVETITTGGGGGSIDVIPKCQIVDGVAQYYEGDITGMFDDVVSVGNGILRHLFYENKKITGKASFPKLKSVDQYGLTYAFQYCENLTEADFGTLETIAINGLAYSFGYCKGLTKADFKSLISVKSNGLSNAFYGCTGLTSVKFDALQSVETSGLGSTFYGCTSLTTVSFPSLTSMGTGWNNTFKNCTKLTEIHFRSDMQATVEAISGYSSKFGATNATIYFDL